MLLGWEVDLFSPLLCPVSEHGQSEERQLQWVCTALPEWAGKVTPSQTCRT